MDESPPRADPRTIGERPELPTTSHWRIRMRRGRDQKQMSQAELGRRVGVSQNVISKIETGEQESSELVVDISRVLGIPLPFALFADELDERWYEAGRLIKARNALMFRAQVEGMEAFAKTLADAADERG